MRSDATSEPGIPNVWILNDLNLLYVSCPIGNQRLRGTLENPYFLIGDNLYCILSHRPFCYPEAGQRPPTLACLGLTHDWGRSRRGLVRLKRKTSKKRLRHALVAVAT